MEVLGYWSLQVLRLTMLSGEVRPLLFQAESMPQMQS